MERTINIDEAMQLLQNLHDYAERTFDYESEENCIIHNFCISIAEAIGVNNSAF